MTPRNTPFGRHGRTAGAMTAENKPIRHVQPPGPCDAPPTVGPHKRTAPSARAKPCAPDRRTNSQAQGRAAAPYGDHAERKP